MLTKILYLAIGPRETLRQGPKMNFRSALLASLFSTVLVPFASADPVTITDIAGRDVTVEVPAKRMILGEGRQIYLLAALEREDPFARVVGWREDLLQADPDSYGLYAENFRS
jgi:iron complex transport system substrate-binding protein